MTLTLEPSTAVPLRTDADNTIRIGQTRVPLETLMHTWNSGSSPEEIVEAFPALHLDDVYAVIAYVLRHPAQIKVYLEESKEAEETALENLKTWFPASESLRSKVLARAKAKGLR
jgi:uncharacterized protein (DUF433 family)